MEQYNKVSVKPKLLAVISVLLLNYVLYIIIVTPPSEGYELSIYDAYPTYFFILILISFSCSFLGVLYNIFTRKITISCLANIFTIVMLNAVLVLLPIFRGYAFYQRHDALSHVGMIKDILISGHVGDNNFYPVFHIISSVIIQITNLNFFLIRELIPAYFYYLYVISISLISIKITGDRSAGLFAFLFASVPLLGGRRIAFTPSDNLFFLLPFIFYIFYLDLYKSSIETKVLLIVILLLIPYMHPEIVILLMIIFVLFPLSGYLSKAISKINQSANKGTWHLCLVLFTSFFTWFSMFSRFSFYTRRLYFSFLGAMSTPPIEYYSTLFSRSKLTEIEVLELFIKREGAHFIYLILASLVVLIIVKNMLSNRKVEFNHLFFGLVFLLSSFLMVISLFVDIVIGYERVLKYVILFSTLLVSVFFINYKKNLLLQKNKIFFLMIFLILIISTTISTFNLYPSPIIKSYNQQVTSMEISGTSWLIEFGDKNLEPIDMFITFGRFVHALQGYQYSMQENKLYATALYNTKRYPPDHFNYTHFGTLGESYSEDKYMLTNKLMKLFYFELWPKHARFTPNDFVKLNSDPTVDKIYLNGELEIYYIRGNRIS
ncbi:hypothetical protein GBV73_02720 [Thermococcus sp. 101 C5]|uniref:hypothetical protein n=1 Tax=Thermococcus sp. 101 C5 TaxID=2654197 RepID=UPI00128BDA12|nr:hypothetical protein [Thermococcus sp. 101 C5]MPW38614.1 hypothetical protein [Thermococcus sp. 101 C5]